jgi:hypothetical protein
VRLRAVRPEADRLLAKAHSGVQIEPPLVQLAEIHQRIYVIGSHGQRRPVGADGFLRLIEILQYQAEVVVRVGVGGVELDFPATAIRRLREPTLLLVERADEQVQLGETGLNLPCPVQAGKRVVQLAQLPQHQTELAIGLEAIGPESGDFQKKLGGLQRLAPLGVQHGGAEKLVRIGGSGRSIRHR